MRVKADFGFNILVSVSVKGSKPRFSHEHFAVVCTIIVVYIMTRSQKLTGMGVLRSRTGGDRRHQTSVHAVRRRQALHPVPHGVPEGMLISGIAATWYFSSVF